MGLISQVPRIVMAGERSGVGKSTITVGILLALKARGLAAQPFKVGPDFLDPMHHSILMDRKSRNLDTWMFPEAVKELFVRNSQGADVAVIEGVMGMYDGFDGVSEEGSTAHLAKTLDAPVILVLDAQASARSLGAVALGFQEYDRNVNIAGVIFNNVAGERHLQMLESSLRGVESLGGLLTVEKASLSSRHLGLVPAEEDFDADRYDEIRRMVEERLDIDRLLEIARTAGPVEAAASELFPDKKEVATIGVAKDSAFNFYYEDNLDILRSHGARIEYFSPMAGELPDVDGLYFGGGYPEVFAKGLASSVNVREKVKRLSDDGMAIYAECGGMMYACRTLRTLDGRDHAMTGIFDARVEMTGNLQALGYVEAKVIRDCVLSAKGRTARGHVFHYSHVAETNETEFAYDLDKQKGISGNRDGFVRGNTMASYTHLHFGSCPGFADSFVRSCAGYRRR
jgi:cobyrinic acid a,c-diamide synthase